MNLNNFTIKAQEAVQQAVQLATEEWAAGDRSRTFAERCHYDG